MNTLEIWWYQSRFWINAYQTSNWKWIQQIKSLWSILTFSYKKRQYWKTEQVHVHQQKRLQQLNEVCYFQEGDWKTLQIKPLGKARCIELEQHPTFHKGIAKIHTSSLADSSFRSNNVLAIFKANLLECWPEEHRQNKKRKAQHLKSHSSKSTSTPVYEEVALWAQ